MSREQLIQLRGEAKTTHYFVYKNQHFPFNIHLFLESSNYFLNHQKEFESKKYIQLFDDELDDNLNIPNEIITDFINYVHRQPISLKKENVSILNYLAKKYEIDSLNEATYQYIEVNLNDIIIQILSIYQNDKSFKTDTYEDILSAHLSDYIEDDCLLSLNFPILYRILTHQKEGQKVTDDKIINFYFKCLDKYGRKASVLFADVDFGQIKTEFLNTLIFKYSKIFDFHFINEQIVRSVYEMQNDTLLKNEEMNRKQKEQDGNYAKMRSDFEEFKLFQINKLNEMEEKMIQRENQQALQLSEMEAKYNQQKKELVNEFESKIEKLTKEKKIEAENVKKYREENEELKKSVLEIKSSFDLISTTNKLILTNLEPKLLNSVFSQLETKNKILLFNQMEEKMKILLFNQMEEKMKVSFINQLESDKKIFLFSQLDEKTKLSIFNQLELKSQVSIFNQMNPDAQLSFFSQLSDDLKVSIFDKLDKQSSIRRNLLQKNPALGYEIKVFNRQPQNEFNGIIKYLTDKTGGNIHDNGTIEVTSNSIEGSNHPKYLLVTHGLYVPKMREANFWVCFDFKNMEIEITSYTIKSSGDFTGVGHIKSWVIEISNDHKHWIKIDQHSDCQDLNGSNRMKTYDVKQYNFSRYCKFRHISDYYGSDQYYLGINCIEFYGKLKLLQK